MERFTSFDFGLTGLAALFHQDWGHLETPENVVSAYLSPGEGSDVGWALRKQAAALGADVAALLDSSLSDQQIESLWEAATGGNYRFAASESGRGLLRRIGASCDEWQQLHGDAPADADPRWRTSDVVVDVREAVRGASLPSHEEWRQSLDACARFASADVAFRLLLRICLANFLAVDPMSWARYQELASVFSYGEDLLPHLAFLVDD